MNIPQEEPVVVVQSKFGLCLSLRDFSVRGITVRVHNFDGSEAYRFLIDNSRAKVVLRDFNSGRTLTLEGSP